MGHREREGAAGREKPGTRHCARLGDGERRGDGDFVDFGIEGL